MYFGYSTSSLKVAKDDDQLQVKTSLVHIIRQNDTNMYLKFTICNNKEQTTLLFVRDWYHLQCAGKKTLSHSDYE